MCAQSCPTLCEPMDCSLPGSSVHGIFQARTLEWAAISSSRVSSLFRDRTHIFWIASRFFTTAPPKKTSLKAQPVLNPDFTLILANSIIVTRVKEESEVMIFIITPVSRWVKYAEDVDSIPGLRRSSGGGNGSPLQCSCLENPMDRAVWRATVHGLQKNRIWLSN